MPPRRPTVLVATALVVLLVGGCGEDDEATPVACRDGSDAYVAALGDAPGEVLLSGEVPISECLTENQEGGLLATVGASMIDAATELNEDGRADPGGDANFEAGYRVGSAERGAEETSGIHIELIRRLTAAALYSPGGGGLPAAYLRAYREGLVAGRERG